MINSVQLPKEQTLQSDSHSLIPQRNVSFEFNAGKYIVKTAESAEEIDAVLRLRHEVYYKELLNTETDSGLDQDYFDTIADHVIVKTASDNTIIATYRIICSQFSKEFYSAGEFDISALVDLEGTKIEVGRACVKEEFRNSIVVILLWKGISEYVKNVDARYIFGCSSIKTTDILEIQTIYRYLSKNYLSPYSAYIQPHISFRAVNFHPSVEIPESNLEGAKDFIPPLLNAYLNIGCLVAGEPAFDAEFKCFDFLTVLDVNVLPEAVKKKYNLC